MALIGAFVFRLLDRDRASTCPSSSRGRPTLSSLFNVALAIFNLHPDPAARRLGAPVPVPRPAHGVAGPAGPRAVRVLHPAGRDLRAQPAAQPVDLRCHARPGGRLRPARPAPICWRGCSAAERDGPGDLADARRARAVRRDARRGPAPRARCRRDPARAGRDASATCWSPGCSTTAARATPGCVPRIVWSLGEAFGAWVHRLARRSCPGLGADAGRGSATHAERSARPGGAGGLLAAHRRPHPLPGRAAGCRGSGALLKLADEAN